MKTEHKIFYGDAREMKDIPDNSINLMITSPPYPMIEMWDEMFSQQNVEIGDALKNLDGERAFELMHKELDKVWKEVYRALSFGGIACINIGDATRSLNGKFQIYPNHARILNYCLGLGFHALPEILWVKETNSPNKFMGSGMLPTGAYVTLEHEHILILRKEGKREFKQKEEKLNRQKSAFFWEERNIWFSDKWKDIKGISQKLNHKEVRERSAAYPFELAYRLINMYSTQNDVILDPFLGTGTTTIAAMCSKRNSVGYEIDPNFKKIISARVKEVIPFSEEYNKERLKNHLNFIMNRKEDKELKYISEFYGFKIMTKQEKSLVLYHLKEIKENDKDIYEAIHEESKLN